MPHALIVDDDVDALASLAPLVGMEGFSTAVATTLQEAREEMARQRPDVVLLDLVLPDGDGMDLFQDVESRTATEIIDGLTAYLLKHGISDISELVGVARPPAARPAVPTTA